jgi:hypothetical protein
MQHSQLLPDLTVAQVMNHWPYRGRLLAELEQVLEQAEQT